MLWDIQLATMTGQRPIINDADVSPLVERLLPQSPDWPEDLRPRFGGLFRSFLSSDYTNSVMDALRRLFDATELIKWHSIQGEDGISGTLVIRTLFAGYKLSHYDPTAASTITLADHDISILESLRLEPGEDDIENVSLHWQGVRRRI